MAWSTISVGSRTSYATVNLVNATAATEAARFTADGYLGVPTGYKIGSNVVGVPGGSDTYVQYNVPGCLALNLICHNKTTNTITSGYFLERNQTNSAVAMQEATPATIVLRSDAQVEWGKHKLARRIDTAIGRNAAGAVKSITMLQVVTATDLPEHYDKRRQLRRAHQPERAADVMGRRATSTPNSDACDQWDITALAAADVFVAPSGTPSTDKA
jgi:hypothetical protein